MFSVRQKREIADRVQTLLRDTGHPELPEGEIQFNLHVSGAWPLSWADICNNGAVPNPSVNPHNEQHDNPDSPVEAAMADGVALHDIEDAHDAQENQTGDLNVTAYPSDEPLIDPFDCLEDSITILIGASDYHADESAVQLAVVSAKELLIFLRKERKALQDIAVLHGIRTGDVEPDTGTDRIASDLVRAQQLVGKARE